MQIKTFLTAALFAAAVSAQNVENPEPAAVIHDNPAGKRYVHYTATTIAPLPPSPANPVRSNSTQYNPILRVAFALMPSF